MGQVSASNVGNTGIEAGFGHDADETEFTEAELAWMDDGIMSDVVEDYRNQPVAAPHAVKRWVVRIGLTAATLIILVGAISIPIFAQLSLWDARADRNQALVAAKTASAGNAVTVESGDVAAGSGTSTHSLKEVLGAPPKVPVSGEYAGSSGSAVTGLQEVTSPASEPLLAKACDWYDPDSNGAPSLLTDHNFKNNARDVQLRFLVRCGDDIYAAGASARQDDKTWLHAELEPFDAVAEADEIAPRLVATPAIVSRH